MNKGALKKGNMIFQAQIAFELQSRRVAELVNFDTNFEAGGSNIDKAGKGDSLANSTAGIDENVPSLICNT